MKKIIKYSQLEEFIKKISLKKVLVTGCFDIFHFGHFCFLKKAKKEGEFLIVGLESDRFIKIRKKRQPFHTQSQRAKILSSLEFVDLVVLLPFFSSPKSYYNLLKIIRPQIIAVSAGDPYLKTKKEYAALVNAKVKIVISRLFSFSSTLIYKKLTLLDF